MKLGIYSFGDLMPDPVTGKIQNPAERINDLLEEIELADQAGLDFFGLGEHHRPDYIVSAPAVVLAAAASRTKNIRLGSAVTVLSSEDPVRVHQQFATLDLISGGRAEILAGRGSFIESFPLFGYDLDDYDELFTEKLDLLLKLRESEKIVWSGSNKFRAPLTGQGVYPRPAQKELPVWIAVGGSPESVARAGHLGLPLAFAIIGGLPERFVPFIDLYRESGHRAGHDDSRLQISINSHGFIADTSQQAADIFYPAHEYAMNKIGRERGWPPSGRAQFETSRQPRGNLILGSPQEVIDKILFEHELFKNNRAGVQFTVGSIDHKHMMHCIELYGTVVAPAVRKVLGGD